MTGRRTRVSYIIPQPGHEHRFGINRVTVGPPESNGDDNTPIVWSAGRDATVKRWRPSKVESGATHLQTLEGHVDWVTDIAITSEHTSTY